MKRLRCIVNQVKDKLHDKEQEMGSAELVIPYLAEELKKRRHEVFIFEQSLKKVPVDVEIQPSVITKFKNDAQELIIEINKVVV